MKRIAEPLEEMGAKISMSKGSLPMIINGNNLAPINFELKIPSAQVKSGLLLASLYINGETNLIENKVTRDHTEVMLESFGANIEISKFDNKKFLKVNGQKELISKDISVPNDLSSSAFFIVAALINKNSRIILHNINNNPTRNGLILALKKMGAKILLLNNRKNNNENICDIEVETSNLNGCELGPEFADLMIDEYPILSIAACFANSPSVFRGLKELKVKESDRLELILSNLKNCGVKCKTENDDLFIYPSKNYTIKNNIITTNFDHRIAMAFCIMGSKIGPLQIKDSESIRTSFPTFKDQLNNLGGNIS